MTDSAIIDLYWARREEAIGETRLKYGTYCYTIAHRLLGSPEDAEECVSDTYHAAWNAIPPERPKSLRVWLGRVVRNLSLNRWNREHRQKRDRGLTELLGELEDCLPSRETAETALEARELGRVLEDWLGSLPREDRRLFLRRYWYGMSLQDLAGEAGMKPAQLAQRMLRLRRSLKNALEKEGIEL